MLSTKDAAQISPSTAPPAEAPRTSEEYKQLKKERAQVLYKAIERVIPDLRERIEVELIGSPLTHERFLRRPQGTYGMADACQQEIQHRLQYCVSCTL